MYLFTQINLTQLPPYLLRTKSDLRPFRTSCNFADVIICFIRGGCRQDLAK